MRWQGRRESRNVEDRRSQSRQGIGGLPISGKGGIVMLVVILVAGYYGVDLSKFLSVMDEGTTQSQSVEVSSEHEQEAAKFTSVILASTEDTWSTIFSQNNQTYIPPKLVLYTNSTRTGCGLGQALMGPFYCPTDRTVYIDLAFYQEMKNRLGGGGDFAQGYVIAHEVGHHVQNILGTADKIRQLQQGQSEAIVNQYSVKLELQADCYAGLWGHSLQKQGNILEYGDLETALKTAQAIGDDQLQKQSTGRVMPDSFTHGTSQQRYDWFKRGFDQGTLSACDTFIK